METRKQAQEPDVPESGSVERRFFHTETRAKKTDGGKMTIGGKGVLFNRYTNMGWFAEVVEPTFFDGIKSDRCACLLNHDVNHVLGRERNGTLKWEVLSDGVDYESVIPSHRSDVFELVDQQYIYVSSFGFTVLESRWAEVDRSLMTDKLSEDDLNELSYGGKISVRYLVRGKELFDFSPVTFAAYEGTTTDTRIAKRSFDAWKGAKGLADARAAQTTITLDVTSDVTSVEGLAEPAAQQQDQNTRAAKALAEAALALY